MSARPTVGLYLDAPAVLQRPGYLEALQERIGLNLVILGFSGELPPEVLATSPYDGVPPSDERLRGLLCRHLDGQCGATSLDRIRHSAGPHVSAGGSDAPLRQAIARAHGLGLRVWLLGGGWTANDFDVAMFCPSQAAVNGWYEAVYTHMATAYGVDGVDITHARYPMTSFPRGLFLCTCDDCARTAAELGFDMPHMLAATDRARSRLARYDGARLAAVLRGALGVTDAFAALGMASGVGDWFTFRARLIERQVGRFRDAVHAAAGADFTFGVDTYPASLALFAGHDQTRWNRFSDFASPLVSHLDIFPMQTLTAWTRFLQGLWPTLAEGDALALVSRFAGYDSLGLPARVADFRLGEPDCEFRAVPLVDFVLLDTAKARLYLPADMPSYPIIQGGGAPHRWPRPQIEAIIEGLGQQGHQGYMLQGTESLVE
ncbi:MAG: hypothetical protein AB1505_24375 [Candidatus Latescibacterota bacterium]